jgi:hypothetical protein
MPEITPENLDLLKKLQPLFKRVLGEWKIGHYCYSLLSKRLIYVDERELFFLNDVKEKEYTDKILRIPTLEELWEMVDWSKWSDFGISPNGLYIWFMTALDEEPSIMADPYSALLQALCRQEGV